MERSPAQLVIRRRSARHAARRRQRAFRALLWCGLVTTCLASAAGYALGRGWFGKAVDPATPSAVAVTDEQRVQALQLIDQAVSARYEGRMQGAFNAISDACRLNPDAPGLDIFVGEVAWEQRNAEMVRRAALEALTRGHNESGARLLLALEKWMSRLGADTATVGSAVRQMLIEAEEASPSNAAPFFFHGEISRLLGDGEGAHRKLLGAMHRQTPWASAALLEIKLQLAAAEATELERSAAVSAPSAAANAVLKLRSARFADRRLRDEVVAELLVLSPVNQTGVLLDDPALEATDPSSSFSAIREQSVPWVPHQNVLRTRMF